jgi:hypothetical protein
LGEDALLLLLLLLTGDDEDEGKEEEKEEETTPEMARRGSAQCPLFNSLCPTFNEPFKECLVEEE